MKNMIQCLILIIFLLFQFACSSEPPRSRVSFNDQWKFLQQDDSLANRPAYDDSGWRTLNLPHDWSIEGDFSEEHPTEPAGGALPAGIGWYRKSFMISETDRDKRFYIDFDGIYRNSEIWINGHYLGKRADGYSSFRYELTPYLQFGDGTNNVLAVKVDNSLQPNSRWYTGSGIYRNVWLVSTGQTHIDHWGMFVTTPQVDEHEALVNISLEITASNATAGKITMETAIKDSQNKTVARTKKEVDLATALKGPVDQSIRIQNPALWSVENPNLYQAVTSLYAEGRKVDQYTVPFGIRYFRFDADSGFYLNGEPLEIRGVNLHHDLGALGAAVNTRAIERQLEIMQGMGVNAIRTAHNPPAPELLDLCDQMGLLVMDEAFDVWRKKKKKYDYHFIWDENYEKDLRDLIRRDRNHPSVFAWSIGNEIREQFDSTGIELTRKLTAIVKSQDTTRPVTCALTETNPEKNFIYQSGALDVLGFNYKHEEWAHFNDRFPGEKMIATENMSAYATRGHYDMPSDSVRYWPQKHGEPIIGANDDYTVSAYDMVSAYWGSTHEETLKAYYQYDFIAGLFIWSGIDFIGEPVPYGWPAKSSYYGVVDLAGFPKDTYYLYKSIWTDTPTLHIFPHWNWEEGKTVDVWAYYNQADEVELLLNGESLGRKNKSNGDMHVMWRVQYEPGTLQAISYQDGEQVLEKNIQTAGKPARIELSADRQKIKSDGRDLSFVTVKITDQEGNMVPNADNLVNFDIEGPGFMAGVDNGYQASHEPFKASQRKAFKGLCLAIIQSDGQPGSIQLTASSDDLDATSITINVE